MFHSYEAIIPNALAKNTHTSYQTRSVQLTTGLITLHSGQITSCNEPAAHLLGFSAAEVIGQSITRFLPQEAVIPGAEVQTAARQKSGESLPLRVIWSPVTTGPMPQVVGMLHLASEGDQSQQEHVQTLLREVDQSILAAMNMRAAQDREQIELQRVALEAAANAIVITDSNGRIVWLNPAWERLTGYSPQEVIGLTFNLLKSGRHSEAEYRQLWQTICSGQTWFGTLWNRRKDGTLYLDEQTITPVRDASGTITHYIAIKQDVTERQWREEKMDYLATHDPVTELPNRRVMNDQLVRLTEQALTDGKVSALLLLDLDKFKLVNDTMGHLTGDQVLRQIGQALQSVLRPSDLVARVGGDEFAVILECVMPAEAEAAGDRLCRVVDEFRFNANGKTCSVGVSVGVAMIDGTIPPGECFSRADNVLYAAKVAGGNRVLSFQANLSEGTALKPGLWVARIKDAIAHGRLVLHYQPIVHLKESHIHHYEALVRMVNEDGTISGPSSFLHTAEEFGLMPRIDHWVVDQVVTLVEGRPNLKIFVNLAGQSLGDERLLSFIEERIRRSGTARQITFEITENIAIQNLTLTQRLMSRLSNLGCGFALDDFGSGFSSLRYLKGLTASIIKIDGHFVRNLEHDAINRSLIKAITAVARDIGKEVVAEWVESAETAHLLGEMGVDFGQGYYWGRPSPDLPRQPGAL